MSFAGLLHQTVTILPGGSAAVPVTDAEGNVVTPDAASFTSPGRLQRRSTSESRGSRTVEQTGWLLFLPAGTPLTEHDRVRVDDELYEVDGPPERVQGARAEHHVEVLLQRVSA